MTPPGARSLPSFLTPRLRLRPLFEGDAPALLAIYGDEQVIRHASDPAFSHPGMVLEMLSSVGRLLAEGASFEWGIETRHDGTLVGTCGLHSFAEPQAAAEIGAMLARFAWGRGYMTEALGPVIDHARQTLGLRLLRADIDAENVRSLALFRRLGFRPVGGTWHEQPLVS
jgi:RimJ/RimL family protein N-acetyltransferase